MKKTPGLLQSAPPPASKSKKPGVKRIFLVDDHPMMRDGISRMINEDPRLVCCGQAPNAEEALRRVQQLNPDLVITDITLPGGNGLELIKDLKAVRPNTPVLVFSMHDENFYAERVLRA